MNRAYWIVSIGFGSCLLDRAYSDNARDLACLGQRPDELLFNKCSNMFDKNICLFWNYCFNKMVNGH